MLELKDFYEDEMIKRQVKRAALQEARELEDDEEDNESEQAGEEPSQPDDPNKTMELDDEPPRRVVKKERLSRGPSRGPSRPPPTSNPPEYDDDDEE
jgi:hypothetical protein